MTIQIAILSIMAGIVLYVAHQSIVSLIWALRNPGEAIQPGYHCPGCHLLGSDCECPMPKYGDWEQCQKCGQWLAAQTFTQILDDYQIDGLGMLDDEDKIRGLAPCGSFWIDESVIDCPAGSDHKLN